MVRLPIFFAIRIARAISFASRLLRRGEGATLSGRILLQLRPDAIALLTQGSRVVLISGTNGKTSTSAMLHEMLASTLRVAGNRTGANLDSGIAAALAQSPRAQVYVFEVDELFLPMMMEQTSPEAILLLNLSRDQLHRTQEVRIVARKWSEAILKMPDLAIVIDGSDPFLMQVTRQHRDTLRLGFGKRMHIDGASCPQCGSMIDWSGAVFHCPSCKLGDSPLDIQHGDLPAVERNFLLAKAVAIQFGVKELSRFAPKDRVSQIHFENVAINVRLVKNPASWQESLYFLPPGPVILVVNARGVDGLDTSWLWDVDFTPLRDRVVVVTGERRLDAAYRLHLDDVEYLLADSLSLAARALRLKGFNAVNALASYTAFIDATSRVREITR